jgi:hypothetical protein
VLTFQIQLFSPVKIIMVLPSPVSDLNKPELRATANLTSVRYSALADSIACSMDTILPKSMRPNKIRGFVSFRYSLNEKTVKNKILLGSK